MDSINLFYKSKKRKRLFVFILFIAVLLIIVISVLLGSMKISIIDIYNLIRKKIFFVSSNSLSISHEVVLWKIRIPRIFAKKGAIIRVKPKPIGGGSSGHGQQVAAELKDHSIKKKTTPALKDSLQDADPFVRSVSAEVLGRLKEKSM